LLVQSQEIMDTKLHELLGEKTAADEEKPVKKKKEKPLKVEVSLSIDYFCPLIAL
jgi:hypothetical protein